MLTMCCFQPLSLWEFVTEAIENQTGAEPAPRWSVFSASVQVSRARSLRPGLDDYRDGETQEVPNPAWGCDKIPHVVWGSQGRCRPALAQPAQQAPLCSAYPFRTNPPNLPHHPTTHIHICLNSSALAASNRNHHRLP